MSKGWQTLGLLLAMLGATSAHAWGERGHDVVCTLSLELLNDEGLRSLLRNKVYEISRTCLVPDEEWKRDPDLRKVGDSTHWLNPEQVGKTLAELTSDDQRSQKDPKKPVGSLWIRAEQFYRMACDAKRPVAKRMRAAGYLGHFVADAVQPLHLSLDHDGESQGKKGLHFLYEIAGVEALGSSLWGAAKPLAMRLKNKKAGAKPDFLNRLRAISIESRAELDQVMKLSPAFKAGQARTTFLPNHAYAPWRPLLTGELARAAALLSEAYDECLSTIPREALRDWVSTRTEWDHPFIAPD